MGKKGEDAAPRKGKNARRNRLLMLIGIGLGGSILVISLGIFVIYYQNIKDAAAQAAIIGGVLTFLGTSYTALYNEISSYYDTARFPQFDSAGR